MGRRSRGLVVLALALSACDLDGRTLSGGTAPLEPMAQPGDVPPDDMSAGEASPDGCDALVDCGEDATSVPPCNYLALPVNPFCQEIPGGPIVQACR